MLLRVHGSVISEERSGALKAQAAELARLLRSNWGRLDALLQGVRCMVDLFGNLQG